MSVLTRIKNNQITDSSILANTKVVPGSIVGSLFNANLTVASDVTITGNLTVQGASSYLTVASTNTYVNDPLIVLNNAFTGSNSYDIGLIFNRGNQISTALIWNENDNQFELTYTTETGTSYATINNSGFANLKIGNLVVDAAATFGSISTTGDLGAANLTLSGDLAVNGGDLTTSASTFNLINTTATELNIGGDATTLILGNIAGVANIRNATTNILGNATIGGTLDVTGHVTLEGVTSTGATGTGNLVFSTSPVLTTPNIGTPSFANLTNATDLPISTGVSGLAAGIATFLATPSSSNLITAVTDETGSGNLVFSDSPVLTTPNIGTPSFATLTNATDLPISTGVSGLGANVATFLATPSSSNLLDAITDETGTGSLVFATSPTLNTSVIAGSASFDLLNTTATTVNAFGAATTLVLGDTTGVANIRNATTNILGNATVAGDTTLTGDLAVNGGDITTTAATINLLNDNATTVDAFKAATDLEFGATTGTLTINNPTVVGSQITQDVFNTTATTVNAFGAATTLILGDTTGVANIRNATTNIIGNATVGGTLAVTDDTTLTGDLAVNGGDITTTAATFNLLNDNATTVDAFKAATDLEFGATTGTLTINNPTVVGTQATQDVFNTTATTVNAFGAATTLIVGATTGVANIRNATTNIIGNATVGGTLSANSIQSTPIGSETAASGKFTSVTDESLTATRVTFAGTGGDLDDSANLTFATDTLSIKDISINGETNTIAAAGGNLNLSASTNVIDGTGATVSNIADPTDPQDAVTLSYLQTQINSGVTNLQTDNSDITITDDGNVAGVITTNVDGVLVSTITTNSASYFTDLLVIDDATSNVSVNGTLYASGAGTFDASVTINASTGNGLYVSNSTAQFAKTVTFDANIDVSGNINATDTTQSTTSLTGAITTSGGVGIAKNLNVGGDVVITGNLQVDGSVTSVNTATLDVEDLNITVAKGAASSAAANGAGLTIDGANATILWTNATQSINFNKNIVTPGANFTGTVTVAPRFTVTSFDGNSVTTLSGNDITTSATTANLFNTTATTINFAGGATTLAVGANSGTITIGNPTLVGTQTTQAVYNTVATTVNAFGAATTLIVGDTTGVANIRNATTNIIGNATVGGTLGVTGHVTLEGVTSTGATGSGNLVFSTSPVLTTPNIGTPSFANLSNATDLPISTGISGLATGVATFLATPTSSNLINAVTDETGTGNLVFSTSPVLTTPNIGTPGFANLSNATDLPISTGISGLATGIATLLATPSSSNLINAITDETGTGNLVFSTNPVLTTPNIGTPSFANLSNATDLPISTGIGGLATGVATFLATPTSSNLINAVTDETGTGNLVFSTSPTLETSLVSGTISFDLVNTTATTVNFAGAATTVNIGAITGTTTVNNNLDVGLSLSANDINGTVIGNVTPATGAFTSVTDTGLTATRVTYAGTGGLLSDSANFTYDAGILTVQNFSINGATAEISVIGGSGNVVLNPDVGGVIDATGSLISNIANPVSAQDAVTLNYLTTTLGSISANAISQSNSDISILDAATGIITANVDAVNVFTLSNSSANFFSGLLNINDATSNVAIDGLAYISGNATINGTLAVVDDTTLTGNLAVNGGEITTTASTVSVFDSTPVNVYAFGSATNIDIGAASGTLAINNPTVIGTQASQDLYNTTTTTMNFAGAATTLIIGAATGVANIRNATTNILGNAIVGGTLEVTSGSTINNAQTSTNFVVKGTNSSSLILADSANNSVVFGGNLTSAVLGSVATFTGTSAIILPVGDISQRPSNSGATDVIGMARYSTSSNNIEFFDGTAWQVAGNSFTLVTTNAFTGDGSEVNFTLSSPSTTSAVIVAINGVVQYPTLSYSVGGANSDILTFTEAPAVGDIIDARVLSTSTTVSALSNGNGYVQFTVNDNFANVIAGTATVETRMSISAATGTATFMNDVVINGNLTVKGDTAGNINLGDANTDNVIFFADINSNVVPNGNEVHNLGAPAARWANTYTDALVSRIIVADPNAVSVGTSDVIIDTFDATVYRSAKYVLSISNSSLGEYETAEVLVVHNGTTAYKNQYATMYTGTASLGTVSATYNSGTVELSYQGANAGNAVKIQTTYIKV